MSRAEDFGAPEMKPSSKLWRFVRRTLAVVALLVVLLVVAGWYKLFREIPQHFDSPEQQFKYGSIGAEQAEGMPYWIWLVLPRVFPDLLPAQGGYTSLGMLWEPGQETPVGFSKKTIGFPRVALNCALCHAGSFRSDSRDYGTVVSTAPATRVDILGYERFLFACASDPRFTPGNILRAIQYNTNLSPIDKLLYRAVLIPQTKSALLKAKERFAWTNSRPDWGRGRIDPFNPVKFHQLKMDPGKDNSIGNSDMEPIWNLRARTGHLHWDGLNDNLTEVMLSSAVGDGATAKSLPINELTRLQNWLLDFAPPPYPFAVDAALATKGQTIFQTKCAECHAGKRTGTVIPIAEVATDRHRVDMWSQQAANIYNSLPLKAGYSFKHFQKNEGYVATPLSGLWMRAPYLHNGAVPTVEDLLEPAAKRPKSFYRGYDVVDRERLGFVHSGADAEHGGQRFDTTLAGNSNEGHEGTAYGTDLSPDEKRALVQYLKTQ
jgi:hypothetical protein